MQASQLGEGYRVLHACIPENVRAGLWQRTRTRAGNASPVNFVAAINIANVTVIIIAVTLYLIGISCLSCFGQSEWAVPGTNLPTSIICVFAAHSLARFVSLSAMIIDPRACFSLCGGYVPLLARVNERLTIIRN